MIPVGDYVRDALAVVFLLIPLGLAWDLEHQATAYDYVVPVTLLSIISLALPYLKIAAVLPRALTPLRVQRVRLLANIPYLIVVLVTLVRGYGGDATAAEAGAGRGVGMGVVFGLVGVVLAAQGRAWEQSDGATDGVLWRGVTVAFAGLGVALGVLSAVLYVAEFGDKVGWSEIVIFILDVVFFAGLPLLAVRGMVRGDSVWRDVAVVLGGVGLLAAFWTQGSEETVGSAWSLRLAGPQVLLWPALGAAAAAPGISALVRSPAAASHWVNLPGRLFQTITLVAVLAVLIFGFRLVDGTDARGPYLTGLVLSLVILVTATFGRNALVNDASARWPAAVGAAIALIVLGLVELSVLGIAQSAAVGFDVATMLSVCFVFAAAIIVALTTASPAEEVPGTVDEWTGALRSPSSAPPAEGSDIHAEDESIWEVNTDGTNPPASGSEGEGTGPAVYTVQLASDPATPPHTLADIAAKRPSLRPEVARNPATYSELLEWLGQLGDPAVDDALRRRSVR